MSEAPLVTVIIPCFNYGVYLGEAIESALGQTHTPVEVVVVDDGSVDDTAEVAARYGDRITYIHKENGGPGSARNLGVTLARGEFIAFLDADDIFAPTFVEEALAVFREARDPQLAFVYTQLQLFDREDRVTEFPPFDLETLKWGNYIPVCTLIRRDVMQRHRFYEKLRGDWEDWDLFIAIARGGMVGKLLDRPLVYYRRHERGTVSEALGADAALRGKLARTVFLRHWRLYPRWFVVKQLGREVLVRTLGIQSRTE